MKTSITNIKGFLCSCCSGLYRPLLSHTLLQGSRNTVCVKRHRKQEIDGADQVQHAAHSLRGPEEKTPRMPCHRSGWPTPTCDRTLLRMGLAEQQHVQNNTGPNTAQEGVGKGEPDRCFPQQSGSPRNASEPPEREAGAFEGHRVRAVALND
ncbi:hypothetical protein AAFF_G00231600 [Aldrovandia affinis]|uniref:Uncharacterized protein n=1 Tax=Aldrovandia affinis TaxID=143900 RepID=A0AAD7W3Q3_9TELE|nr:hypothetical protein AAFF_G00231600 [Aldrovandia affinis]